MEFIPSLNIHTLSQNLKKSDKYKFIYFMIDEHFFGLSVTINYEESNYEAVNVFHKNEKGAYNCPFCNKESKEANGVNSSCDFLNIYKDELFDHLKTLPTLRLIWLFI